MAWEWQEWRCLEDIGEAFEEKGWEYRHPERRDNEVMPLVAESDGHYVAFFWRDPGTGECFFEVGDKARREVLFVREMRNIPAPGRAAGLLARHGFPVGSDGVPSRSADTRVGDDARGRLRVTGRAEDDGLTSGHRSRKSADVLEGSAPSARPASQGDDS